MSSIILGANGYIGKHLWKMLTDAKEDVLASDIQEKGTIEGLAYQQIDITNSASIEKINFSKFNKVYLFSGITGTFGSFKKAVDFISINEIGLTNVLNKISECKVPPRIIFPSTRLVYKGMKNKYLKEESEKEGKTIYALNKLMCEQMLVLYNKYFNIQYTIVRIGVPFGNMFNNYSYGTIGMFLKQASEKNEITIFGDGNQRRTFTHVWDICKMICELSHLEKSLNNIYNILGENYSIKEVATFIGNKKNTPVNFVPWTKMALALESGDTIFDGNKIKNDLSYVPLYKLENWINDLL